MIIKSMLFKLNHLMERNKPGSKIILMSGGSSQLGAVIAGYLGKKGYRVYAGFNSTRPVFPSKNIIPVKLDISNKLSCRDAVEKIVEKEKKLDVLINVAGLTKVGKFEDSKSDDLDMLLDINTKGAYRLIKEVLPIMKNQKNGKIISIGSLCGLVSFPNYSIYSASKFALEALTSSLRYEVFRNNIYVTNIEPGAIENKSKKSVKMPHKPVREIYPIIGLLLPLVESLDIAREVERVIIMNKPPANVLVGRDVKLVYLLKKVSPGFLWDLLLKFVWHT